MSQEAIELAESATAEIVRTAVSPGRPLPCLTSKPATSSGHQAPRSAATSQRAPLVTLPIGSICLGNEGGVAASISLLCTAIPPRSGFVLDRTVGKTGFRPRKIHGSYPPCGRAVQRGLGGLLVERPQMARSSEVRVGRSRAAGIAERAVSSAIWFCPLAASCSRCGRVPSGVQEFNR